MVGATGVTFFIGVQGTVTMGNVGAETFIAPLAGTDPKVGDPSFATVLAAGTTATDVCGRVDADEEDNLIFEACDSPVRRYMCETCP